MEEVELRLRWEGPEAGLDFWGEELEGEGEDSWKLWEELDGEALGSWEWWEKLDEEGAGSWERWEELEIEGAESLRREACLWRGLPTP